MGLCNCNVIVYVQKTNEKLCRGKLKRLHKNVARSLLYVVII